MIPPDLVLVWSAPLIAVRLWDLYLQIHVLPFARRANVGQRYGPVPVDAAGQPLRRCREHRTRWNTVHRPPAVAAWAAECGIQFNGLEGGAQVCCPRCRRWRRWLVETEAGGAWACYRCQPGGDRLEHAMAEYACALRIGYRTRRRRQRVLRLAAELGRTLQTPADLRRVAEATALAAPRQGFGRVWGRAPNGPVSAAMRVLLIPALIQSLLSPAAYLERFGRQRVRAVA